MIKRAGLLAVFILGFCLAGASGSSLNIIKVKGKVDTADIDGKGLRVYSLWDSSNGSPVNPDGSFITKISDSRPQKVSLKDDRQSTRALIIALPENPDGFVFDARSTAIALLFQDPALFRSSFEAVSLIKRMSEKKSFEELVTFLKINLPARGIEELMSNTECIKLLDKCNEEVFGQDQAAITTSLGQAQNKLQRLLQDQ